MQVPGDGDALALAVALSRVPPLRDIEADRDAEGPVPVGELPMQPFGALVMLRQGDGAPQFVSLNARFVTVPSTRSMESRP